MRPTTLVWLWSADETQRWPVYDWDSLKVTQERFGAQYAEITIRKDSQLAQVALGVVPGAEFYGYNLSVQHNGNKAIFEGPVLTATLKGGGNEGDAFVTLEFEGHLNTALRRRLIFSAKLTDFALPATAPNAIAVNLIDGAMGAIAGPVYPIGYPGGVLRTNYGAQVYQAGNAVGAPAAVVFESQPGKNLQTVVEELCLRYDMCPAVRRTGVAQRAIDIEYPYERLDLSQRVVLTRLRGTSNAFEASIPYTLTTVARSAGAGSGLAQVSVFSTNNVASYAVHEDQLTTPAGSAAECATDVTELLRASNPLVSYKVAVVDTSQCRFGQEYDWRTGVLIYDADYGQSIDRTIIGYEYEATNGGRAWAIDVVLGERPTQMLRYLAGRTGAPYGHGAGARWRDTRG